MTQRKAPQGPDSDLLEELGEDRSRSSSQQVNIPVWRVPDDGKSHLFRILPGTLGKSGKKFWLMQKQHWTIQGGKRKPYDCAGDDTCPYCRGLKEYREKESALKKDLAADPRNRDIKHDLDVVAKIIKNCLPRDQYAFNVVVRSDNRNVQVLQAPKTVFDVIMQYYTDYGDMVTDEYDGNDFSVVKKKENGRTSYSTNVAPRASMLAPDEEAINDLLDHRHNLESLVREPDIARMEDAFYDMVDAVERGEYDDGDDRGGRDNRDDRGGRDRGGYDHHDDRRGSDRPPAPRSRGDEPPRSSRRGDPRDEPPRSSRRQEPEHEEDDIPMSHEGDRDPSEPAPRSERPARPARPASPESEPEAARPERPARPSRKERDPETPTRPERPIHPSRQEPEPKSEPAGDLMARIRGAEQGIDEEED